MHWARMRCFSNGPTVNSICGVGFRLEPGAKVLMVEDVVTTGLSSREAIAAVAREGGEVVAEVALVDRSNGDSRSGRALLSARRH